MMEGRYKVRYPGAGTSFASFNSGEDAENFATLITSHSEGIAYEVVDSKDGSIVFQAELAIVKYGMRETTTMEFLENVALERDCE